MPIPTPDAGQSKDDFLASCMADPTMTAEYPDADQRYAVCQAQWAKPARADWTLDARR
jgi:hypothetical protein